MVATYKPNGYIGVPGGGSSFATRGKIFYVDGTTYGNDSNTGLSPQKPFETITYALTQCTANEDDYIIVLRDTSAVEAAFPVAIAVTRVHVIGLGSPAYPYIRLDAQTANPAFEIGSCQHYEIAGFELGAGDTNHACIEGIAGPGTAGRAWIHHCSFGWLNGVLEARDGIHMQNTFDWCMSTVEDCLFNGPIGATNGLTRDGIRIEGNATRSIFRNNYFKFRGAGGIGIHCIQNGSDIGLIQGNLFAVPDAADGEAITLELGVGNALITDNRSGNADNASLFIPYRDLSTGVAGTALNNWSMNYDSNGVVFPATA